MLHMMQTRAVKTRAVKWLTGDLENNGVTLEFGVA